ncbi:MAG: hypothetical protein DRG37_07750 [Deltaproteobacteria bacterium]|nr:MAG: hypothetical protein DRG37_07750 [Deltaproteobacteria bacterium]
MRKYLRGLGYKVSRKRIQRLVSIIPPKNWTV